MTEATPTPPRALIFGHSHVWAIKRAVPQAQATLGYRAEVLLCGTGQFPNSTYLMTLKGKPTLNPALQAAFSLAQKQPQDWLVSFVQGNYYNQLGMITAEPGFDFVLPGSEDLPLDPALSLLPQAALRDLMLAQMEEMPEFLRLLSGQAAKGRIIVLGPPPPPRDDTLLRELAEKAKTDGGASRISPSAVRLKLWRLQNELMVELCKRHAMIYLPGGYPEACEGEGYLKPDYVKDAVHATSEYGILTLQKIGGIIAAATTVKGEAA